MAILSACTGSYDIEVRFENAEARERAVRTEIALVTSCDEQILGRDPVGLLRTVEIGKEPAQPLGTVEQGEYGLYARAIDESCRVVAAGCTPISVRSDSSTFGVELADRDLAICDPSECGESGRCVPNPDGGVALDSGNSDGGVDADSDDIGVDADSDDIGVDADADAGCEPLEDRAPTFQPSGRLSVGGFSCVIAEGRLFCFGETAQANFYSETPDCPSGNNGCIDEIVHPRGDEWRRVSVGDRHGCAIDERRQLYCWGSNSSSQLGTDDTGFLVQPVSFPVADVATSQFATCALKADTRTIHCWGADWGGQTGVTEGESCSDLEQVERARRIGWAAIDACPPLSDNPELGRWQQVVGWFGAFCGQHADGRVFCWGAPNNGATGIAEPRCGKGCRAESLGRWDTISAGFGHFCGIRDGDLRCWGDNAHAQLGQGFVSVDPTPDVSVCADGEVEGVPGDRDTEVLFAESLAADPVRHPEGRRWMYAAGGFLATCALDDERDVYCWGLNDSTNIGSDNPQIEPRRLNLPDGVVADEVEMALDLVCIRAGDDFYCRGNARLHCPGEGEDACTGFRRVPIPL